VKILHVSDLEIEGEAGGIENYIKDVKRYQNQNGEQAEYLNLEGGEVKSFSKKMPKKYIEYFTAPLKRRSLQKKLREINPDVIHVHHFNRATLPFLKALRKTDAEVVRTFHLYGYLTMGCGLHGKEKCEGKLEECLSDKQISVKQYLFRKPIDLGRKIMGPKTYELTIAPSRDMKQLAEKWFDTEILPNFVDAEKFQYQEEKEDYIAFFGRLRPVKGVDMLLEAYQEMETDRKLKFLGDGDVEEYREKAEEIGVSEKVEFTGYLEEKQLIRELQGARTVIMPSRWRENHPLACIESMSCGTPVIGSDIGGIPDFIEHCENGYLFEFRSIDDLKEKINEFLELSQEEEIDMRRNARETAENHSIENHVEGLKEIYDEAGGVESD